MNIKLLPEYLKSVGYSTHAFGKWHLGRGDLRGLDRLLSMNISGFCSESYLPLNRGFDTFNGLYIGDEEDFNQERKNIEKGWRGLYKNKNRSDKHETMFDSLSYGEKISELIHQDQSKDRPFFIYFAPLTKVYPNQRNSFEEIIMKRKEKISQLDQAVDMVRTIVR